MAYNKVKIGNTTILDISDASYDLLSTDIISGKSAYSGYGTKVNGSYVKPQEYPLGGNNTAMDGLNTSYISSVATTCVKDYFFTKSILGVKSQSALVNFEVDTDSIQSIGDYAFYNCPALDDDLELPALVSLGQHAFDSCSSLTKFVANNCTNIGGYAFASCSAITEIHMTSLLRSTSTMCFNQCSNCYVFNLPTFGSSSSYYIPTGCFNGCTANGVVYILPSTFYISTSSTKYPMYADGEYIWYAKGTSSIALYRSDAVSTLIATLTASSTTYTDTDTGVVFTRTGSSKMSVTHP